MSTENPTTAEKQAAADQALRKELLERVHTHGVAPENAVEQASKMYEFIKSGKAS